MPLAVVLLLGEASPEAAAAALAAGADGYVVLRDSSPEYLLEVLEHARRRHGAERARRAHPLKVLHVDWDESAVARVRHQLLAQTTTVQLDSVPTVDAAFRLLIRPGQQTSYDALLLAHRPPGVDALAALRTFREGSVLHIPVVVLVAPGDGDLVGQVFALGAADVVSEDDAGLARLGTALAGRLQGQVWTDERTPSSPPRSAWVGSLRKGTFSARTGRCKHCWAMGRRSCGSTSHRCDPSRRCRRGDQAIHRTERGCARTIRTRCSRIPERWLADLDLPDGDGAA